MSNNIDTVTKLLNKSVSIIKEYEEEMDKDGCRFNIFSILNVASNEVRLHSTFIAELLDSNGTHTFGKAFMKSFLNSLNIKAENILDLENYRVEVEVYIGKIDEDYTEGGRIDIHICDNKTNKKILIENKIFAGDQENQLLRYYNYDPDALLLYLTLDGQKPSDHSTKGKLKKNKEYYCISYKTNINLWLQKCIEISKDKPKVPETISQYRNIILNYTEQNLQIKMNKEIEKLISSNKEFYNSVDEITEAYDNFKEGVKNKFWDELGKRKPNGPTNYRTNEGIELYFEIDEDVDGFWYGFNLEKDSKNVNTDKSYDNIKRLWAFFKKINPKSEPNEHRVGWILSKELASKFLDLDKDRIFELNNQYEMEKFINKIITELDDYIEAIQKIMAD
jgi:hypothetical protein